MRTIYSLAIGILSALIPIYSGFADADGEREVLARISHEIQAIRPLISQATSQANPDARIRFQYDWLRQDLNQIRRAIQEHIDTPRSEPRTFPPLRGDYRR